MYLRIYVPTPKLFRSLVVHSFTGASHLLMKKMSCCMVMLVGYRLKKKRQDRELDVHTLYMCYISVQCNKTLCLHVYEECTFSSCSERLFC